MEKSTRISTGSPGLDEVLGGGLPRNRLYLISGSPGTGKTTLALNFLLDGHRQGEKGLYVGLSETKEELAEVAQSHGWSLEGIGLYELEKMQDENLIEDQYTVFHPAEVELGETTKRICAEVEKLQPARVVFDSLSEMRLLARDPLKFRRQILALKQFFTGRQCTVMLLDDRTDQDNESQLQTIAHGVIVLDRLLTDYGTSRRRLHVVKMRGVQFRDGDQEFIIRKGGLTIFPRLAGEDEKAISAEGWGQAPSGVHELDQLMGGGIDRGTSNLVVGPAGTGKSTLVSQYVWAALQRGEGACSYLFEESRYTFLQRARGLGMDFAPHLASGLFKLRQIDPAQLTPGQFTDMVRQQVTEGKCKMIAIDSINGYINAMPSEKYLLIQMHELLMYLNSRGVSTFIILAQQGMVGSTIHGPVDVSYLADTIILLRYFEASAEVRQAISVVKRRGGGHERTLREFRLDRKGIHIGHPLRQFEGVLTGIPVYRGEGASHLSDSHDKTKKLS